jgi:hypothetical protein
MLKKSFAVKESHERTDLDHLLQFVSMSRRLNYHQMRPISPRTGWYSDKNDMMERHACCLHIKIKTSLDEKVVARFRD